MARLLTDWRLQFPEFRGVSDTTCQQMLDGAMLSIDAGIWGPKADQGQSYLAAHMLASSPFGQAAKMVSKDGSTTYEKRYKQLVREVTMGFRVTS